VLRARDGRKLVSILEMQGRGVNADPDRIGEKGVFRVIDTF
jgi:hypothetical protein